MRLNVSAIPFPITPFVFTVLTSTFAGDSKRFPSIYVIIQMIPVFKLRLSGVLEEPEESKPYPSSRYHDSPFIDTAAWIRGASWAHL